MSFQVMLQQLTTGFWADTADLFSDTVIFPATWHGCIFWTCEQVQAIKLDR